MPRKRKTAKEGSAQASTSQPRPAAQQTRPQQTRQVSEAPPQPQEAPQEVTQQQQQQGPSERVIPRQPTQERGFAQPHRGRGQPYQVKASGRGRGRGGGEAQGPSPGPGVPPGSYSSVAPVSAFLPDLPQAVQPHASATSQQEIAGAEAEAQPSLQEPPLPLQEPPLPLTPLEEQLQGLSLQVPKPEEGGSSQVQAPPMSTRTVKFPARPGKGQTGTRCIVKANHFFAELPDKDLHQYDVSSFYASTSVAISVMERNVVYNSVDNERLA